MLTNLQSFANFFTFTKYILNEKLSDAHIMYLKSFEPPLFFGNQYMDFHMRGNCSIISDNSKHTDQKNEVFH